MEQSNSRNRTFLKISLMFFMWGIMVWLRAMIVIPDDPAPVECVYVRPEKKVEKKIEQRDTIYLISGDWFFPLNFPGYSYPWYGCGGVIYVDSWGYPGYPFPSYGGFPVGYPIVISDRSVDSTQIDSTDFQNTPPTKATSSGPLVNMKKDEASKVDSNSLKHFFQEKRKGRVERRNRRKEKRLLRKTS